MTNPCVLRLPPIRELAHRWGAIEPVLKRATMRAGGCFEPIDVLLQAMNGQVGVWLIEGPDLEGVAVSEIRQYPRKRVLIINFVAGRRLIEWWPEFVAEMDAVARKTGCSSIGAYGRPGWVRFWAKRGIASKVASEIMIREL